jgi:myo-inositol 2-dehydrogenase/D-chiro-inositol 1-dehydrogenase
MIRIAVIGIGRIGELHARHLTHRIPNAELSALVDPDVDRVEALAQTLGVETVATRVTAVLGDPAIDAVAICSPTDTHADLIVAAARKGKHIFCEKPVDHDLGKIDHALTEVHRAGVKLMVGFNRRFDPNFAHVQAQVAAGVVGATELVRITSRDPAPPPLAYLKVSGGMFLDMTIHDFDMARFLVPGANVTSVYASGCVRVDPAIGEAGDIDTAVVVVEFDDGTLVTIDNSRRAAYGYDQRIEVFGTEGVVWADNNTAHRTGLGTAEGMLTPRPLDFFMDRYIDSYIAEMQAFITALDRGTQVPVGGVDGRVSVLMALAANRSRHERRPVYLSEFN